MILSEKTLEDILNHLDNSITKLAKDAMNTVEFHMNDDMKQFLNAQYDIRLENLLQGKNSNIHHLESKLKNKIIQRKQKLLEHVSQEFKT